MIIVFLVSLFIAIPFFHLLFRYFDWLDARAERDAIDYWFRITGRKYY